MKGYKTYDSGRGLVVRVQTDQPTPHDRKFYTKESKLFAGEDNVLLSDKLAKKLAFKVKRKFDSPLRKVTFTKDGKWSYGTWSEIEVSHNPSVFELAHELAHTHCNQKIEKGKLPIPRMGQDHNTHFFKAEKKIMKYIGKELKRRKK